VRGPALRRRVVNLRIRARQLGGRRRQLPDFLIIGAQRAGTTSLFNYLALHPQVASPLAKEPNYFSLHWSKGESWYRSHFPVLSLNGHEAPLSFEASPYYLFHPHAPGRAAETVADAKLIALLRHPVERAFSHHQHNVHRGLEPLSFADAVEAEDRRLAADVERLAADPGHHSVAHRLYSYCGRGRYAEQLTRWFDCFARSRVLVVRSEDLYADPASVFDEVTGFLGLERWRPAGGFANFSRSRGNGGLAIPPHVRRRLVGAFAPHNARLSELLGRDFSSWDR
jgi:hypothetical protein